MSEFGRRDSDDGASGRSGRRDESPRGGRSDAQRGDRRGSAGGRQDRGGRDGGYQGRPRRDDRGARGTGSYPGKPARSGDGPRDQRAGSRFAGQGRDENRPRYDSDDRRGGTGAGDRRDDRSGGRDNDRRGGYRSDDRRDSRDTRGGDRGGFRSDNRGGGYRSDNRGGDTRGDRGGYRSSEGRPERRYDNRSDNRSEGRYEKRTDSRPARSGYGSDNRGRSDDRPSGNRYEGRPQGKSYGDRDNRGGRDDRRPSYRDDRGGARSGGYGGDRRDDRRGPSSGDRRPTGGGYERKSFGDRDRGRDDDRRGGYRPSGDRPERSDRPVRSDRPDRKPSDRPEKRYDDKRGDSRGGEGRFERKRDDRPQRDRSEGRKDFRTMPRTEDKPVDDETLARELLSAPELPEGIEFSDLDEEVRRELRTLPKALAETVGKHLVAAGGLLDEDPEAAMEHAKYAKAKASRVPIVREALGLVAYHAGNWSEALSELRAVRRMTRADDHIAIIADAERAIGRPERALDLAKEVDKERLSKATQIELAIVAAGARRDLGQLEAAVVSLQGDDLKAEKRDPWSARLFYAYADNLAAADRKEEAIRWFLNAAEADEEDETDAAERAAELTNG
ncbi:hypothetical protein [Amycolatopsis regifaucium]|uniref:Tetratrico peptide repeat group 5 domain-containing protein n=1 Tax=Amycolatopsis regifaucium TaxID=546365 RepID=A0A154M641_9PSEU|nr:hypothetical protein [Amycolatopsis regifaucium]KZB79900.1 hypothetical protein AVL48_16110 [Amycolatopsis regifaucium]OKA09782.1 hypothetical protein ATP06_0205300 [Amycolatopsis regifaucium]SFJ35975.1 hypothetical protein SAMN04489731_11997 [Amycolatopsis regifaucium]